MPAKIKKRFVSLYFSSTKLQVLILKGDNRSVDKFASVDLPQGLIVNHQVVDQKKLAQVIIQTWQKLRLNEKNVGIVIPEFSTFIKTLTLPNLKAEELDEAVRWQAMDLLPSSETELVLDWKIIESSNTEHKVLVVAVEMKILRGYVDAVGMAGLYPLLVETPSLSITRLSDHKESGKLVVYYTPDEVLLVVARGDKIFGSSITDKSDAGVSSTAQRIVEHYSDVRVQRIAVGGIGLTQGLLNSLEQNFQVKPEWMLAKVEGLNPNQIQEYLIPISLQSKDPKEPRDEYSINLLPSYWVKSYEAKGLKMKVSNLARNTFFILLTILFLTFGFYLHFSNSLNRLKKESLQAGNEEVVQVLSEAQAINTLSEKVNKITGKSFQPQEVINKIVVLKTEEIRIDKYQVNFETGEVTLNGRASNRLALINFKKKLDEDEQFTQVVLPLSSIEKEFDIDYELEFMYAPAMGDEKDKRPPLKIPLD